MKTAGLLACLLALAASPQEADDVARLLKELDDENVEQRDRAAKGLVELGFPIRAKVEAALRGAGIERAARLKSVLHAIDHHPTSLPYFLDALMKEHGASLHEVVRQSTHRVRITCLGKPWPIVEAALKKSGFQFQRAMHGTREGFHSAQRYCERTAGEWKIAPGIEFQLRLTFGTEIQLVPGERSRCTVTSTTTFWIAKIDQPLEKVLKSRPFPKGSVLDRLLDVPEVVKGVEESAKFVDAIIEYGFQGPDLLGRSASNSWVFRIHPTFKSPDGKEHWRHQFHAASGLDPATVPAESEMATGSDSKDTLEPLRSDGGSRMGPSDMFLELRRGGPSVDSKATQERTPIEYRAYCGPDLAAVPPEAEELVIQFPALGESDLSPMNTHPNLTRVTIESHSVTPGILRRVATLPKLTRLTLHSRPPLDNDSFKALSSVALTELEIGWGPTDEILKTVSSWPKIKILKIGLGEDVTDKGLSVLSKLKDLEELQLWLLPGVTNNGMTTLSGFPSLRRLTLGGLDGIDDRGLKAVCGVEKLESLTLYGQNISDEGLKEVERLKNLKHLQIQMCNKVTRKGTDFVKSRLPGLEYVR